MEERIEKQIEFLVEVDKMVLKKWRLRFRPERK